MTELTRAQLAARIGYSVAVVRKWERLFADYVSSPPGVRGVARARLYGDDDVVLFGLIAQMRNEGLPLEQVRELLPERLAVARGQLAEGVARPVDYLPAGAARGDVALFEAVRQLEAVQGALDATEGERDYLRDRVKELEDRLIEETGRRAAAEAERDMLAGRGVGWWARFVERMRKGN